MAKVSPVQIMDAIRNALTKSDMPQQDIARRAKIHPVNLSQFKAGKRALPLDTLCDLAEVVGLEVKVARKRRV
jgi:transcriptional regulator with XRE-family HTH domain